MKIKYVGIVRNLTFTKALKTASKKWRDWGSLSYISYGKGGRSARNLLEYDCVKNTLTNCKIMNFDIRKKKNSPFIIKGERLSVEDIEQFIKLDNEGYEFDVGCLEEILK